MLILSDSKAIANSVIKAIADAIVNLVDNENISFDASEVT